MNFHEELKRIAEHPGIPKKDREILLAAAIKLLTGPEPKLERLTPLPDGGYHYYASY